MRTTDSIKRDTRAKAPGAGSKTSRPRLPRVLARPRLFEALDQALVAGPAVWIAGPPGSGKSTLAADYSSRRERTLWYRLDESDRDLPSFFGRLATLAAPGQPMPDCIAGIQGDPIPFARDFFHRLYAHLPAGTLMVLDDCHAVGEGERLHTVLAAAIENAPTDIGLLMLARVPMPAAYARLRVNRTLNELPSDALRLTPEELAELAALDARPLPPEVLVSLHQRSQGWAAGAVLLLGAADGDAPADIRNIPILFDYFLTEVYGGCDAVTRQLLLHASLLPSIAGPLLDILAESREGAARLEALSLRRFFVDRLGEDAYCLHPLFREFLRVRALAELGEERCAALRRRAAELFDRSGQSDAAAELLADAGDVAGLRKLVAKHADTMMADGRHRTLLAWIAALPEGLPSDDPWLTLWRGRAALLQSPSEARADLEQAFEAFRAGRDTRGTFEAWCAIVESILQQWDDYAQLDRWLALFPELEAERRFFDKPRLASRAKMMQFTALLFRAPADPQVPALAAHADRLTRLPLSAELRLRVGAQLVRFHMWCGEFGRATVVIERLRSTASTATEPLALLLWYHMEAFYLWFARPRCQQADAVDRGLAVAQRSGIHILDMALNAQGAYAALGDGDLPVAERYLDAMRARLHPDRRLDQSHYHYLAAWHALARGDERLASEHAASALTLAREAGTPFPEAMAHMVCAEAHFAVGNFDAGDDHLRAALHFAEGMPSPIMEYVCRLSAADAMSRRGDRASALASLKGAFALGRRMGYETALWWSPGRLAGLCLLALDAGIETAYVRAVIRRRGLLPPGGSAPALWPWIVRIRALGPFMVELDEGPLRFRGKAQQRPLELLQIIVAHGGESVPKEVVMDALWPDQGGDAAVRSFNTTLHRLRRLLEDDAAVRLSEGRLSLNSARCWSDLHAFEQAVEALSSALARTDGALIERGAFDLLAAYPAPLLAGQTASWALLARERLHRRFQRHVNQAGQQLEALGRWEAAEQVYRAALELDPLAERLCQGLLRSLLARGLRAEALQTYLAFHRAMAAELGVAPAPATVRLGRQAGDVADP